MKVTHKNIDVPEDLITQTIKVIQAHISRYNVGQPYSWANARSQWAKNLNTPISNQKHNETPDKFQQWTNLTFEHIMIPYVYPEVDKWIEQYMPEYKDRKYNSDSIWYLIYKADDKRVIPKHTHIGQSSRTTEGSGQDCCSGVFYLQAPGDESRNIKFFENDNSTKTVYPKTNELILFPVDLYHSATQYPSNMDSIAIAFNIQFY